MREEYEQPSWPDGSQEEIAHLFARREYLTERMEAATDPNLRSSFAYEISVLEARLADLTKPRARPVSNPTEEVAAPAADPGVGHDDVPEEFYQTLEISNIDLNAAAWPGNAARPLSPEPQIQQLTEEQLMQPQPSPVEPPQEQPSLEPVEYMGDEYHRDHTLTADQPMAAVPPAEPSPEPRPSLNGSFAEPSGPAPQPEDHYLPHQGGDGHGAADHRGQGHNNTHPHNTYADDTDFFEPSANGTEYADTPFDDGAYNDNAYGEDAAYNNDTAYSEDTAYGDGYESAEAGQDAIYPKANDTETAYAETAYADPGYTDAVHDGDGYDEVDYEPADELTDDFSEPQFDQFADAAAMEMTNHAAAEPEDPEQLFRAQHQQFEAQQQARQREDLDYFGRPQTTEPEARPAKIGLPKAPDRSVSAAMANRRPARQQGSRRPSPEDGEHRYFDEESSANTESEVQLDGFDRSRFRVAPALVVAGVCIALLAGVLWVGGRGTTTEAAQSIASGGKAPSQASEQGPELAVTNVRAVLDELGMQNVVVDYRDGVIHAGGPVPTQADLDSVSAAVKAVAGDYEVNTTALVILEPGSSDSPASTTPAPAAPVAGAGNALLQSELDRILAVTPLIFDTGQSELTALHQRALNSVVLVLQNQPGAVVTITGYTDEEGTNSANRQVSLARAESVRAYLVSQGISQDTLNVDARGEESATGSSALAGLERRVEFEVETAPGGAAKTGPIRVALVAPSAMNDLAFTQSMVDSLNLMAEERDIEVSITDNTFVPEEAAAAIENYASQGFDLIIAHGSQFGASLIDIAPRYPTTAFAWGTASDTFGLSNVYAYDAAAEEGGYVLGTMATMLSSNRITGVVGPIDVGDAAQYVRGFQAGAAAQDPASNVLVSFTGSFSDITLASEAAQAHIDAGAEVLTGSAQMVVGAISTADQQGVKWFGTQANQASLAPNSVVASQVYRWDVAIRPILDDVAAGTLSGTKQTANLANGGLVIEFNPGVPIAPEIQQRAADVTNAIISGQIDP